jgi:hypothetical protein
MKTLSLYSAVQLFYDPFFLLFYYFVVDVFLMGRCLRYHTHTHTQGELVYVYIYFIYYTSSDD